MIAVISHGEGCGKRLRANIFWQQAAARCRLRALRTISVMGKGLSFSKSPCGKLEREIRVWKVVE
jgi:hypothetical protein